MSVERGKECMILELYSRDLVVYGKGGRILEPVEYAGNETDVLSTAMTGIVMGNCGSRGDEGLRGAACPKVDKYISQGKEQLRAERTQRLLSTCSGCSKPKGGVYSLVKETEARWTNESSRWTGSRVS